MKTIRNLNELKLVRQKLKFQEKLYERDLSGTTTAIVDNLTDRFRDLAFDLGTMIVTQLISGFRKSRPKSE